MTLSNTVSTSRDKHLKRRGPRWPPPPPAPPPWSYCSLLPSFPPQCSYPTINRQDCYPRAWSRQTKRQRTRSFCVFFFLPASLHVHIMIAFAAVGSFWHGTTELLIIQKATVALLNAMCILWALESSAEELQYVATPASRGGLGIASRDIPLESWRSGSCGLQREVDNYYSTYPPPHPPQILGLL